MYIRVTSTPYSPRKSVKIVEGIREGFKVKQVMIHHVGVAAHPDDIEKLQAVGRAWIAQELLRREQVCLSDLIEEKRVIEGIHDVAGHVYDQIGYHELLSGKKDQEMLKNLVLMRLANPSSKYHTQQILDKHFDICHDLDALYRLMDKLYPKIGHIKQKTFSRTLKLTAESIDILFFDCTTLYFESTQTDEVRQFGYSKDPRFNTTQVVLALATNADGLPVGYELFEGNKAEVKTLLECLNSWKDLFKIGTVCFVADRAMMSESNLQALEEGGHQYVIAAKLRSMPSQLKTQILDEKNYTIQSFGEEIGWVGEFDYQSRRLVVSYKSGRAKRDLHQRNQIVEKINKRLGSAGKTEKLISNQGVKKYTKTGDSQTVLDENKIAQDAEWDGLHGVISNIKTGQGTDLLQRYGRLWKIEESFRLNKHTLSMRPIYHFKPERVKTHIALCYMAFSVLRHMEYMAKLTQKISPKMLIDELMSVQASYYFDSRTEKRYRLSGVFSQNARKIYRAFDLIRRPNAQALN